MRKYSIGAVLLDKEDPSKVIARSREPILTAADEDREGYVPNVVYTCGAMKHGDIIFIPYGVADSSVAFAFVPIAKLRSEEHTSELQSLMRISYAVFCLKKKTINQILQTDK